MKDAFNNIIFLKNSLKFYIDERKRNLPTIRGGHHTIRFTNEELEKNELLVENLLKEFITEKNMDRYIWDLYDLRKGLYKRLTRKILEQLLCHEAIKPVEYIDHIERIRFANKQTKFSDYVSKFIDDENENYQKKKEKRAYLQKLKEKNHDGRGKVFVSAYEILNYYTYVPCVYVHPFQYPIINEKFVITWNKGKETELREIKINNMEL